MVRVTFWMQLLLLVFILRQSAADYDHFGELQNEISSFKQNMLTRLTALEHRNGIVVRQYYVFCCYCDTAICSVMLCGWLLCCYCDTAICSVMLCGGCYVVIVIQLYVV
jgi:hypothetical protein